MAEVEVLAREFVLQLEPLRETNRLRVVRASLQALVRFLAEQGRTAHLAQLPEGSRDCPAAYSGLALPLLVLHVEHVVVVFDDALNGVWCYVIDASELDRGPLPTDGWTRIPVPSKAHQVVASLVRRKLAEAMVVAP